MARWDDGYVTDVSYTAGYYQESAPVWMATAATLLNAAAPDPSHPFRYVDLGCGYGVTALVTAATMPHADVWGFDINPDHVRVARDVARRAGLTNVTFEEASFEDLAHRPANALPAFDFIAAHGVLAWITPENRQHLYDLIGQRLAPGGMVYLSYNVAPGWAAVRPIRTLIRLLVEASGERSDVALAKVYDLLDRITQAGAAGMHDRPVLTAALNRLRTSDQRYVVHEMLNRDWHLMMFPEVASAMAAIKCDFIGSASLHGNHASATLPPGMRRLFDTAGGVIERETLRDIASGNGFRTDLFQRGRRWLSAADQRERFDGISVVRTAMPAPEPLAFRLLAGEVNVDRERYTALLTHAAAGPITLRRLLELPELADWPRGAAREAVALLTGCRLLAPVLSEHPAEAAVAASARLNRVHAELCEKGYPMSILACPALGGGWPMDTTTMLAVDALHDGAPAEFDRLVDLVLPRLQRGEYKLNRDGAVVTDPALLRAAVAEPVGDFLTRELPTLRRLGVLPPATAMGDR